MRSRRWGDAKSGGLIGASGAIAASGCARLRGARPSLGGAEARRWASVALGITPGAPIVYADAELASIHCDGKKLSVDNLGRMARF
jgi:hypothetical protein